MNTTNIVNFYSCVCCTSPHLRLLRLRCRNFIAHNLQLRTERYAFLDGEFDALQTVREYEEKEKMYRGGKARSFGKRPHFSIHSSKAPHNQLTIQMPENIRYSHVGTNPARARIAINGQTGAYPYSNYRNHVSVEFGQSNKAEPAQYPRAPSLPRASGKLMFKYEPIDPAFSVVRFADNWILLWDKDKTICICNLAAENTEDHHIISLPIPFGSTITSIDLCSNYIFYTTTTVLYAIMIADIKEGSKPEVIHVFNAGTTFSTPLHSLRVHKVGQLLVAVFGAGYGVQYSQENSTYLPSISSVVVCEFSLQGLMNSIMVESDPFVLCEIPDDIYAYNYRLKAPIFAIASAVDEKCKTFIEKMQLRCPGFGKPPPSIWPYNVSDDELSNLKERAFLKICVSTVTMQPAILVIVAMVNLQAHAFKLPKGTNIVFSRHWYIPFINRSKHIILDTFCPARDPMALSDDGSWLLCWCYATESKRAIWMIALDVSFFSLIEVDQSKGMRCHQFNFPCPVTNESPLSLREIIQISGQTFSSTSMFYILYRIGDTTALYTLTISPSPAPQYSQAQWSSSAKAVTLMRIDSAYTNAELQSPKHISSIAFYDYFISVANNRTIDRKGMLMLLAEGLLIQAKMHPIQQSAPSAPVFTARH